MEAAMLQEYIVPEILILIPVLWLVGYFIKQTPKIPNWSVVWILLTIGVLASLFIIGPNVNGVIQGVLATGISVLGYDLVKQTKAGADK